MDEKLIARGRVVMAQLDAITTDNPRGHAEAARAYSRLNDEDRAAYQAAKEDQRIGGIVKHIASSGLGEKIELEVGSEIYREQVRASMLAKTPPASAPTRPAAAAAPVRRTPAGPTSADIGRMDAAAIAAAMTPAQRQAVQAKLDVENRVKAEAERRASEQAAADRAAAEIHCQHLATIAAECQKAEAARAEEQRRAHISATWDAAIAANNASNASPARPLSVFGQAAANLRERYSKQKGA